MKDAGYTFSLGDFARPDERVQQLSETEMDARFGAVLLKQAKKKERDLMKEAAEGGAGEKEGLTDETSGRTVLCPPMR